VPHQTQPAVGHTASLHFVAALTHAHHPCEGTGSVPFPVTQSSFDI
jgi:hypothetical protein